MKALIDQYDLIIRNHEIFRKYSFHWQDGTGKLKIRWDNARHWKNIETFPHHKHVKEQVQPSRETTIEEVLAFIQKTLKSESDPTKTQA